MQPRREIEYSRAVDSRRRGVSWGQVVPAHFLLQAGLQCNDGGVAGTAGISYAPRDYLPSPSEFLGVGVPTLASSAICYVAPIDEVEHREWRLGKYFE